MRLLIKIILSLFIINTSIHSLVQSYQTAMSWHRQWKTCHCLWFPIKQKQCGSITSVINIPLLVPVFVLQCWVYRYLFVYQYRDANNSFLLFSIVLSRIGCIVFSGEPKHEHLFSKFKHGSSACFCRKLYHKQIACIYCYIDNSRTLEKYLTISFNISPQKYEYK